MNFEEQQYADAHLHDYSNSNLLNKTGVPSISNIIANNSSNEEEHEFIGIRRFARAYLFGSSRNSKRRGYKQIDDGTQKVLVSREEYFRNKNRNELQKEITKQNSRHFLELGQCFLDDVKSNEEMAITKELYNQDGLSLKIPDLTYEDDSNANESSSLSPNDYSGSLNYSNVSVSDFASFKSIYDVRKVVLKRIPPGVAIRSILSQVAGGPLENFSFQKASDTSNSIISVELTFVTPENALAFMRYSNSSLFQVNGKTMTIEWGKINVSNGTTSSTSNRTNAISLKDMSRCLILKKYNSKQDSKHLISKEHLIAELDIKSIKEDFEKFGTVFDVTPIISRKLCVSISYYNIKDAMAAMDEYESPGTIMHKKYYKNWAIWYGKDITDKPCFEV